MGRFAFLLLAVLTSAFGQWLADPAKLGHALGLLSRDPFQATFRCQMTAVRPWLNFSLRIQAGYLIETPMDQFAGAAHELRAVTEITPAAAGAKPVYLANRFHLAVLPSTGAVAQMSGAYLLGAGTYNVRMVVYDEAGRACRADWPVTAAWNDARLRPPIPVNTVAEFHWAAGGRATEPVFDRLTVLLNAAPVDPRMSQLTAEDAAMLLGGLDALLDQVPARAVRLVAFNLDQQKELMARDGFTAAGLDELEVALHNQQLAVVDYRVLQNRNGPMEMLANLVNREMRMEKPADAVVFLGPELHTSWNLAKDAVAPQPHPPECFYFQFYGTRDMRLGGGNGRNRAGSLRPGFGLKSEGDDGGPPYQSYPHQAMPNIGLGDEPIASLVGRLRGRVFSVGAPQDFERGVQRIRQRGGGR
ncbi:MAG: hypothetical protein ABSE42_07970 [Bryobacteraceae bacterium]|jgi:hypothetical protein